jgi:penicillin-binding protein 2
MLTTPLQLAHATAVLARDGQAFQPRILHATREQGNLVKVPEPPRALPAVPVKDARHWETVKKAMVHVVHGRGGTARKIGKASPFLIAGKTGTAQVFSLRQNQTYNAKRLAKHLLDHALFVAYAPAENPRIAVAVIAENGGGGSKTAAPIAKQVLDAYLIKRTETAKGNGHAG